MKVTKLFVYMWLAYSDEVGHLIRRKSATYSGEFGHPLRVRRWAQVNVSHVFDRVNVRQ